MRGKPKYKVGDKVQFELNDRTYTGEVYIVDKYGTFFENDDVSYDVMVEEFGENKTPCLVKHLTERFVKPYKEE